MHSLQEIIRMNEKAAARVETNFDRHCSFEKDARGNVILHSARLRNTAFLPAGSAASKFLAAWWSRNSQEQRDRLVESYF